MAVEAGASKIPPSPPASGRASPRTRPSQRRAEDGTYLMPNTTSTKHFSGLALIDCEEGLKPDKSYRRYATNIERALSLFDTALQEWADYISFLGRLLKVSERSEIYRLWRTLIRVFRQFSRTLLPLWCFLTMRLYQNV